MSILITGSESFLAKHLKKILKTKKIKFTGVDNIKSKDSIKYDILKKDFDKVIPKGTKTIIHLAAISSTNDFKKNPKKAFDININGTFNLIRAASKKKVKKIIFASSEWVYGEFSKEIIKEKKIIDYYNLGSEYALSKAIGENLIHYYCKKFNIKQTIFRFGIIYGPRFSNSNWSAVESIAHKIFLGQNKIEVGSSRTARRFIFVKDVASAILKSTKSSKTGVYNLSGDKLISLKDIINISGKILGRKVKIIEKNKKNFNFRNTDNTLVKKTFNWKPAYNFNKGMNSIIESFKSIDDKKNYF